MTKKIKFIVATLMLTLGFFFCFCFAVLSVSADEGVDTQEPTTQEEQPKEEKEETTTDDEQVNQVVDLFMNHIKDLKWEEAEALIGWVIAYLVANFGVIVGFAITLILKHIAQTKDSKAFKEAIAKLELENQEKTLKLIEEFENKLKEAQEQNNANVEYFKKQLELKQDENTKQIALALNGITENLNKVE